MLLNFNIKNVMTQQNKLPSLCESVISPCNVHNVYLAKSQGGTGFSIMIKFLIHT